MKLVEMIQFGLIAPIPRRATKPTKGSQRRRVADKKRQSEKKRNRKSSGDE